MDVSNYLVAMRQARGRYRAAVQTRILQQQLLDAEQKKLAGGASTPFNVVQQQRDLVAAQSPRLPPWLISAMPAWRWTRRSALRSKRTMSRLEMPRQAKFSAFPRFHRP